MHQQRERDRWFFSPPVNYKLTERGWAAPAQAEPSSFDSLVSIVEAERSGSSIAESSVDFRWDVVGPSSPAWGGDSDFVDVDEVDVDVGTSGDSTVIG